MARAVVFVNNPQSRVIVELAHGCADPCAVIQARNTAVPWCGISGSGVEKAD